MDKGRWVETIDLKPGMIINHGNDKYPVVRDIVYEGTVVYYKILTDGVPIIAQENDAYWIIEENHGM